MAQRINTSRGVINVRDNRADSQYHSLQLQLDRAFSKGLFFRLAYTYGKLLDDSSEVFTTFASPTSYSANLAGNGLRQDWGPSAYDRRNIVVLTYSWTPDRIPLGQHVANVLLGAFTRNFTISGQTQLYSGLYTQLQRQRSDINGDGSTTNDRPVLANPTAPITRSAWMAATSEGPAACTTIRLLTMLRRQRLAFATQVTADTVHFLVPNAANGVNLMSKEIGRNSYANAGQQYWNVALEKAVPTPFTHLEGSRFVFRVEAQQLGNHNNVTYFTNNVTQVGLSTSRTSPAARSKLPAFAAVGEVPVLTA